MMVEWEEQEAAALVALQRGIALETRPFAALGRNCGLSEEAVIAFVHRLSASGEARRFGAVFDARRLGYRSALCAMSVPQGQLRDVAAKVVQVAGVTHAYERGWPDELPADLPGSPQGTVYPNLWFTLAAPADSFANELETLRSACQPYAIHELPATRRFKIDVVFDVRTRERDERVEPCRAPVQEHPGVADLTEADKAMIRLLQGNLAVTSRFFEPLARELGMAEAALLRRLEEWQSSGVLRRIGLLLRHRDLGFKANGMCCWDVPDADVVEAGRRLAAFPEVTHCYERPRADVFPYRLYAMIHTPSWRETHALFLRLSREVGLADGRVLLSLTEFKKTSMQFF